MPKLINKTILFALLILTVLTPVALVNKFANNRMLKSTAFKLKPNIDTLIVGDSHAESSIDPRLLPGSVNLSARGESVFFTYYKLRQFLNQNPGSVRKVVLAFSYHNIAKKYQDGFLYDDLKSSFSMEKYYLFLDYAGKKKLFKSNNFNTYCLKYDFGFPLMEYKELGTLKSLFSKADGASNVSNVGGFIGLDYSKQDQNVVSKKINLYYLNTDGRFTGCSQIMIDYLDKIASICAEQNIKLYLYNSPLNVNYRRQVPTGAYDKYGSVVNSLINRYPGVTLLDMSKEPLDDSYFNDGDHLDKLGAAVTSRKLGRFLYDSSFQ
jgi:hypothetical protein